MLSYEAAGLIGGNHTLMPEPSFVNSALITCNAVIIACRFKALPACVKVMLTSRPQTLVAFEGWEPEWIEPSNKDNLDDMRVLTQRRMLDGGHVSEADLAQAVELVVRKSQVCCAVIWFSTAVLSIICTRLRLHPLARFLAVKLLSRLELQ